MSEEKETRDEVFKSLMKDMSPFQKQEQMLRWVYDIKNGLEDLRKQLDRIEKKLDRLDFLL